MLSNENRSAISRRAVNPLQSGIGWRLGDRMSSEQVGMDYVIIFQASDRLQIPIDTSQETSICHDRPLISI